MLEMFNSWDNLDVNLHVQEKLSSVTAFSSTVAEDGDQDEEITCHT